MKRYDISFSVTGYIEAENKEEVEKILEDHLILNFGETIPFERYDLDLDSDSFDIQEQA